MPLHQSNNGPDWINRKLHELERRVRELAAARRLEAATIGAGGLTVTAGGDIVLVDAAGDVVWKASEDPIKTRGGWASDTGLAIPTTWTTLGYCQVPAPVGFIGQAHFTVNVSVGDTMASGSGSVSVQPMIRLRFTDSTTTPWSAVSDTAIASPDNRIAVASSFWAANINVAGLAGYEDKTTAYVEFGVNGILGFGTETGTDGNWHVAASVIFKRGGELT